MPTVVVDHDLPLADPLADRCDDLEIVTTNGPEETGSALADAEILVTNPTRWDDRLLAALDPGDWVQATSAGYAAFPVAEFRDRGVTFANATGLHDPVVAEHAFALAFAFSRTIPAFVSKQAEHTWGPRTAVTADLTDWTGRTLTVYGLGSIGETIAERGSAFGMDVYGVKRDPEDYDGGLPAERVLAPEAFHDVLPETDLLVAIVPLTEETRGSIDAAVFRALPDSAILVNVSRGPVVDEAALVDALREGEVAGAGLDVFEEEPLPESSPLWDREDVLVTPHVGGRSDTFPTRFADLFAENYGRWRADEPLRNRIA
ncbi:MAG: D-2-hydroxyacid dehydrogenase [Haloarculaceae archaeon]